MQDEDGELLTGNVQKDILQTIHAIRTKDPKIYDTSHQFFNSGVAAFPCARTADASSISANNLIKSLRCADDEEENDDDDEEKSRKKKKPYHLKDFLRDQVLEGEPTTTLCLTRTHLTLYQHSSPTQ